MLYYIPVLLVLPLGYKTKTTAGPKTNTLGQHPSMLRVVHGLVDPRVGSVEILQFLVGWGWVHYTKITKNLKGLVGFFSSYTTETCSVVSSSWALILVCEAGKILEKSISDGLCQKSEQKTANRRRASSTKSRILFCPIGHQLSTMLVASFKITAVHLAFYKIQSWFDLVGWSRV